ncbi:HAMP domain-containing protein [Falsirhodobacter algicola]|uniref:histidine kinase n=1 Tax=Falsirhodobacter algicola TaxID=2692330 RepID=A0A8J8MTR8_9RHOB|nr:HAMP domain-containing protein [Falsirhodobacter algicola]
MASQGSTATGCSRLWWRMLALHLAATGLTCAAVAAMGHLPWGAIPAALLIAVGSSLVLARMIGRPLRDLTQAARHREDAAEPGRISFPDMTDRSDEIGRLSEALRDMVAALYDRIDANEQFAADVAHEVKNPLASLRSAVETLRIAREDQRPVLMEIIETDVRRLDRLVSDISAASRLDSELVKEGEEPLDLTLLLGQICEHLAPRMADRGVALTARLPTVPVRLTGLEDRLAQVFVNLIDNAASFSQPGDEVAVALSTRDGTAVVVVEDAGPGIPEEALTRVFDRFYSQRPQRQFGMHSGLGLAISRQIVTAHGGAIWAENRAEGGARLVVVLPA